MRNIIKSQFFGFSRDICTYISLAIAVIITITSSVDSLEMFGGTYTGSLSFMATGEAASMLSVMIICMFATRLCGWDFNDKTINYEVMYGHSRSEVCWARIISAVLFSSVIGFVIPMFPILIFTISNGWGYAIPAGQAVLRSLIFLLVLMRFAAVCVFLTFLTKNSWAAFLTGFLLYDGETMLYMFIDFKPYFTSATNAMDVLLFENQAYGYVNGEDVIIFKDVLSGEFIAGSVIASVVVIALALFGSYKLFSKCDLK